MTFRPPGSELELKVTSFGLLQHSEIMAGLGFEPKRHTGIVLSHHLVEEASGLRRNALALFFTVQVSAALVGFLGVSAQTQLPHYATESLPDVVLHGG